MFALTSTWPYYSIPVWHARRAFLPTTLLWYLEKHAVCFNGNWIWSCRIFLQQESSAALFPLCIPCVSLRDAGPAPGHTFLKHRLLGKMSAALKSAALFAGVGPKSEWGRVGGGQSGVREVAPITTFIHTHPVEHIQPRPETRRGLRFSWTSEPGM